MSDLLSVFDDKGDDMAPTSARPLPMRDGQRSEIRGLIAQLDIVTAARQFDVTAELTGVRIASVGELDAATAHRLIVRSNGACRTLIA